MSLPRERTHSRVLGVSPLAKIGNDSRTMRKDGEELVRVVFDLGARREPQVFAADAVGINIYIWSFNSLFVDRAALKIRVRRIQDDSSWLLQHTPVYANFHNCESPPCSSGRGACGFVHHRLSGSYPKTGVSRVGLWR
jgi:hypothetical protein